MNEVIIKTPEEIEKMRELGKLVAEALDYIGQFVKPGITTNEIDKLVYDYHVNVQGGYPAPLHYGNPPYPKSCCTSVNHVICHGIPDDKPLKEGDIINIDLTIKKDGFHGDSSRMFAVGKISPIAQRLIDVTHESMMAGIAAVKPGATPASRLPKTQAIPSCRNFAATASDAAFTKPRKSCTTAAKAKAWS